MLPSDYRKLQIRYHETSAEIQDLQNQCNILEHILCYSEIYPMSQIIQDYKAMSTFYLQHLAKEINFCRLSRCERSELLNFLEYLHSVTRGVGVLMRFFSANDSDRMWKLKMRLLCEKNDDMLVGAVVADASDEEQILLHDRYRLNLSFVNISMKLSVHLNGLIYGFFIGVFRIEIF